MSSTGDKVKGMADEAAGSVKQGVGKAVGNERLQVEGAAEKVKGQAEKASGDAKDAIKKGADKVDRELHKKL